MILLRVSSHASTRLWPGSRFAQKSAAAILLLIAAVPLSE